MKEKAVRIAKWIRVAFAEGVGSGVFSLYLSWPIGLIPFLFLARGERCP